MAEETKRKVGRPRKAEGAPTAPYYKKKNKAHIGWGGKREGAGKKAKGATGPLDAQVVMRITADTYRRIKALRDATADDDVPFNRMFELWVQELATEYGIE